MTESDKVKETDRSEMASEEFARRAGFDLGWDFAYYGLPCPFTHPDVMQGYNAGKSKFGTVTRHTGYVNKTWQDRYHRKWLSLRANAWARGRVFSPQVTPAYLERIDTPVCPILGIKLTHATESESDWSIDRINNDGAYAPGNLVVLSTQANCAKGNFSFEAVHERASRPVASDGLEPTQWLRMASLMAAACATGDRKAPLMPLIIMGAKDVPVLFCQYLQAIFLMEMRTRHVHVMRPIRKGCLEPQDRAGFDTLVKKIRKREQMAPKADEFWLHAGLFSHFSTWYTRLHPVSKVRIKNVLVARTQFASSDVSTLEWCLHTKGYYEREEAPQCDEMNDYPGEGLPESQGFQQPEPSADPGSLNIEA